MYLLFVWLCVILSVTLILCITLWHSVYSPWSDTQLPVSVTAPSSTPLTVSHSQAAINFCFFHSQMVFSSKNTPVRCGEAARWDIVLYAAQGKQRNIEMLIEMLIVDIEMLMWQQKYIKRCIICSYWSSRRPGPLVLSAQDEVTCPLCSAL